MPCAMIIVEVFIGDTDNFDEYSNTFDRAYMTFVV
ncbi:hypothetical protein OnM2_007012 [Erysiphe neolycopersici]|uniref:Uncharacterized protein n=1 Tax=Erysiphe neolycopersici TaxID=212602 RepID=A0A420I774_9PEZI|nr:hypothetical protein OnM2_007012 [Erysiphe neolycopersici]